MLRDGATHLRSFVAQFAFAFVPENHVSFTLAVVVTALHTFCDIYILFLSLYRVRTVKNTWSAALLASVVVLLIHLLRLVRFFLVIRLRSH